LTLKNLDEVIAPKNSNIRIIHLVRDPRAILASRRQVFATGNSTYNVADQSDYLCKYMERNLRLVDCLNRDIHDNCGMTMDSWRSENYLRLRFEDVSVNPLGSAKLVYDFVGLNLDSGVINWIRGNTKSDKTDRKDLFSTKRDSAAAVGLWRKALTMQEINAIQQRCAFVMQRLNYRPLQRDVDRMNKSLDLYW